MGIKYTKSKAKSAKDNCVKKDVTPIVHTFKVLTVAEINKNRSSKYEFVRF